jgi:hypothetical protein
MALDYRMGVLPTAGFGLRAASKVAGNRARREDHVWETSGGHNQGRGPQDAAGRLGTHASPRMGGH